MRYLPLILATMLAACSKPANADSFGIYGSYPHRWNAEVARQFPLVVVQYQAWERDPTKVAWIKSLTDGGARVIIDFQFQNAPGPKRKAGPMPDLGKIINDADFLLARLNDVKIEGITLDEENSPEVKRLIYLTKLYYSLKEAYPERIFLQWITAKNAAQALSLANIPADGWVFDPYRLPADDYAAYVAALRQFSDRLYSVVWASPQWQVGGGFRKRAHSTWWDEGQWKIFYGQLAINQANDIPSILFPFGLNEGRPIVAWEGDRCSRAFFTALTERLIPYVERHRLPVDVPETRPDWLPAAC